MKKVVDFILNLSRHYRAAFIFLCLLNIFALLSPKLMQSASAQVFHLLPEFLQSYFANVQVSAPGFYHVLIVVSFFKV